MPDKSALSKRPFTVYLLVALLLFQAVSALVGSFYLVTDPTGNSLGMSVSHLYGTPFDTYLVPGLVLGILLGLFPLFLVYPLLKMPKWRWASVLNIYRDQYWAWSYSIYLGVMLIIWIYVQLMYIGYGAGLQLFYGALGAVIIIVTVLPGNKRHYYRWR
jgi:hypothetical protein